MKIRDSSWYDDLARYVVANVERTRKKRKTFGRKCLNKVVGQSDLKNEQT